MLVSLAVQQVIDDLMEADAVGPFSTSAIIDKLNEGIRHLRNIIAEYDPDGQWLGAESDAVYPALTRWANLSIWTGGRTPSHIYSLKARTESGWVPVEMIDLRNEDEWVSRSSPNRLGAVLRGAKIGLRQGQNLGEVVAATTLRMVYQEPYTPIDSDSEAWDNVRDDDIGTSYPFPDDFVEAAIAYAVTLLTMKQESQVSKDWAQRANNLEQDLIRMVRRSRQRQNMPGIRVTVPSMWIMNEGS